MITNQGINFNALPVGGPLLAVLLVVGVGWLAYKLLKSGDWGYMAVGVVLILWLLKWWKVI